MEFLEKNIELGVVLLEVFLSKLRGKNLTSSDIEFFEKILEFEFFFLQNAEKKPDITGHKSTLPKKPFKMEVFAK